MRCSACADGSESTRLKGLRTRGSVVRYRDPGSIDLRLRRSVSIPGLWEEPVNRSGCMCDEPSRLPHPPMNAQSVRQSCTVNHRCHPEGTSVGPNSVGSRRAAIIDGEAQDQSRCESIRHDELTIRCKLQPEASQKLRSHRQSPYERVM